MILYGHPESGHTYKVALSLQLLGEAFEYRWVDVFAPREQRDAEFQRVSRFGEIPVLVDEGVPYAQSNAILLHVASKYRRLGGETQERLAQARERLFWEANRIGLSLPNLRHYLRFAPGTAPDGALEWLRHRMQADLQSLDDELSRRPYLLGETASVADIACSAYLLYDDVGIDFTARSAVREWLSRIRALRGFAPAPGLLGKPATTQP